MSIQRAVALVLLGVTSAGHAMAAAPFVGTLGFHAGSPGNSTDVVFNCESEQRCQVLTTIDHAGKQTTSTDLVTKITDGDISAPQGALDYAVSQRNAAITNAEYIDAMNLLRPILSSNPKVSRCWDLNWPTPTYTLLCTFSGTATGPPVVYAFFALVANCRQAFCGYVIFPLTRRAPLTPSTSPPPAAASPVPVAASDPYVTAFDKRAATVHSTGKWYFELTVDRRKVSDIYPTHLLFGVSDKEHFTGASENVTPESDNSKTARIGIAVDLDNGKLYVRREGAWTDGPPGSNRGSDLRPGRNYYATLMVAAKSHNQEYLDRGALIPNYGGGTPMAFAPPSGYLAWRDTPPPAVDLPPECAPEARARLTTEAAVGRKQSQFVVGLQAYFATCGGAKDEATGLELIQKSALQDYPPALFALGKIYQFVPRNADALSMFEAAARRGYRLAEDQTARMYANSDPAVHDGVAAYAWYSLAASRSQSMAKFQEDQIASVRSKLTPSEVSRAEELKAKLLRELGSLPAFVQTP
jgi:hypothetical protein